MTNIPVRITASRHSHRLLLSLIALVGSCLVMTCRAAEGVGTVAPNFTTEQALRGKAAYAARCAACHGGALSDATFAPPLKGPVFMERWGGKELQSFLGKTITTMPTGAPNSLPIGEYVDIVAYILEQNGVSPGTEPLAESPADLANVVVPSVGQTPSGGVVSGISMPPVPEPRRGVLSDFEPVNQDALDDAPPADWLAWRRDNLAHGFSPLSQIDTTNIGDLVLEWSWALPDGPSQVVPLVRNGIMFVHGFDDTVQALDATTGDLLWTYRRWSNPGQVGFFPGKRSIALFEDRVYVPTTDANIVTLDARSGAVVWETRVANIADGFRISGGPVVANGVIVVGTAGRTPGGNYIVGLDGRTGEELWRLGTVAGADDPGADTWAGIPPGERHGASVWIPGSYDSKSDLVYIGTGQTYDTGPLLDAVGDPAASNDALYTDATLAIVPATGELAWYFQHFPNDQWDLDWAFERQIVELPISGTHRRTVLTGGKIAIFDVLDAGSGRYLDSIDLGLQNIVTDIDPDTGHKSIDASRYPSRTRTIEMVCPHADGAKNWMPSAYAPGNHVLFVPLMEVCMNMVPVDENSQATMTSGVQWQTRPPPDSDGLYGRLQAIDLATGSTVWTHRQRAAFTSGVLATAGDLVFAADLNRYFSAFDQETGKSLWQVRLNDVSTSSPISYSVDGRQFIAITVGHGRLTVARRSLTPEIKMPVKSAATLWVFALRNDRDTTNPD